MLGALPLGHLQSPARWSINSMPGCQVCAAVALPLSAVMALR